MQDLAGGGGAGLAYVQSVYMLRTVFHFYELVQLCSPVPHRLGGWASEECPDRFKLYFCKVKEQKHTHLHTQTLRKSTEHSHEVGLLFEIMALFVFWFYRRNRHITPCGQKFKPTNLPGD